LRGATTTTYLVHVNLRQVLALDLLRSVVDEDVKELELLDVRVDKRLTLVLELEVAGHEEGLLASLLDELLGNLSVRLLVRQISDRNISSLASEEDGDGATDTRVTAGDDDGLAVALKTREGQLNCRKRRKWKNDEPLQALVTTVLLENRLATVPALDLGVLGERVHAVGTVVETGKLLLELLRRIVGVSGAGRRYGTSVRLKQVSNNVEELKRRRSSAASARKRGGNVGEKVEGQENSHGLLVVGHFAVEDVGEGQLDALEHSDSPRRGNDERD
jgi:hypothetical protein